jgi:hypothetical protein
MKSNAMPATHSKTRGYFLLKIGGAGSLPVLAVVLFSNRKSWVSNTWNDYDWL